MDEQPNELAEPPRFLLGWCIGLASGVLLAAISIWILQSPRCLAKSKSPRLQNEVRIVETGDGSLIFEGHFYRFEYWDLNRDMLISAVSTHYRESQASSTFIKWSDYGGSAICFIDGTPEFVCDDEAWRAPNEQELHSKMVDQN